MTAKKRKRKAPAKRKRPPRRKGRGKALQARRGKPGRPRRLTDRQEELVVIRRAQGDTWGQIEAELGVPKSNLKAVFKRRVGAATGREPPPDPTIPPEVERALASTGGGKSARSRGDLAPVDEAYIKELNERAIRTLSVALTEAGKLLATTKGQGDYKTAVRALQTLIATAKAILEEQRAKERHEATVLVDARTYNIGLEPGDALQAVIDRVYEVLGDDEVGQAARDRIAQAVGLEDHQPLQLEGGGEVQRALPEPDGSSTPNGDET